MSYLEILEREKSKKKAELKKLVDAGIKNEDGKYISVRFVHLPEWKTALDDIFKNL